MNRNHTTTHALALLALPVLLACCSGIAHAQSTVAPSHVTPHVTTTVPAGPLVTSVITPLGTNSYSYTTAGQSITEHAPATNDGGDLRVVTWRPSDPVSVDEQTCTTWSDASSPDVQQAVALRVRDDNGRIRAITIAKNVMWRATWYFNVYLWDSSQGAGSLNPLHALTIAQQFPLTNVFKPNGSTIAPKLPWTMCARAVGNQVSFIVWPDSQPKPAWGDPNYGGTVTVPQDWVFAGNTGIYVGHIPPGGYATFSDPDL